MKFFKNVFSRLFPSIFNCSTASAPTDTEKRTDAAIINNTEITQALTPIDADANTKGSDSETAIVDTAEKGHTEDVETLVNAGADVNTEDGEGKPTFEQSEKMDPAIIENTEDTQDLTPIDADVNAKSSDSEAAIDVETLIDAGADVNGEDSESKTALEQSEKKD